MMQIQVTVLLTSILLCCSVLYLVRKKSLKNSYALLWVIICIGTVLFTVIPGGLNMLSKLTGLYYLTALLFLCFLFILILFLHFSTVVSKLIYQNRILGERIAFLEKKMEEMGKSPGEGGTESFLPVSAGQHD
jgi:hypothetical protein